MSGGRFQYQNDNLAHEIFGWHMSPNYGEKGFSQALEARRVNPLEDKQISELVWDVFCLLHSFDWYQSGDICEETYLADVERFKEKWFKKTDAEMTKDEIDKSIEELKNELYKTFNINNEKKEN